MLIISIRESEKEKLLKRHNSLAFHLFSFYLLDILHPFLTPLPQYNLNPFFLLIRIKSQTILIHMTLWVFSHSPILIFLLLPNINFSLMKNWTYYKMIFFYHDWPKFCGCQENKLFRPVINIRIRLNRENTYHQF